VSAQTEEKRVPRHIAIIMDGNGRWARRQGLRRTEGHAAAVKSVRTVITACAERGIEQLTLYAFSTDNWQRPKSEVNFLMRLLAKFLVSEREELLGNKLRFRVIGDRSMLPRKVNREIDKTEELSSGNTGMILCVALNYGAREEIVHAARQLAQDAADGACDPESIDEQAFAARLYTAGMPDPDLLIRTAGEMRVSNFLLWQISYAEFWFTDVCWPDFREKHLDQAIRAYAQRERRFGSLRPEKV